MRLLVRALFLLCLTASFLGVAESQVATGSYTYGTFNNMGFDTINVGNLNAHFSIPVLNKAGRGLPFYYDLAYDSSIWEPVTSSGTQSWLPIQAFGWHADTEITTGYFSYHAGTNTRIIPGSPPSECSYTLFSNFTYHDPFGVSHPFAGSTYESTNSQYCGTPITNMNATATDGSGLSLAVIGFTQTTLTGPNGKQIKVPTSQTGSGVITDTNGNQITTDGAGHYTDTTGNVVLTVAGSAPSNKTFTYTDTQGNPQKVAFTYKTYTVQTNFGCNGVTEYPATSTSLVNTVNLPDGSSYKFSYELTPGSSTNVTGRLASVTLPQGGQITYAYTGGTNGIVCADGSNAGLTRTMTNDPAASKWVFTRTPGTGTSTTNVTDGLGNKSVYNFVEANNQPAPTTAVYYETERTIYQGTGGTAPSYATNLLCEYSSVQSMFLYLFDVADHTD